MSKHSATIDEFYATTPYTAKWLTNILRTQYGFEGKTALEPCVGAFVFPDTARDLTWTTNDLNKWTDRAPDTQFDFLEADFGQFDFIITNPPFGAGNKLAFNFAGKACRHADVVAMVVPSIMGEWTRRLDNIIPRDCRLAWSHPCPNQWFDLPDGTKRRVRTHAVIFERVEGYHRERFVEPILDIRTPFFEFTDKGDYGVRVFGDGMGDIWPVHDELPMGCFMKLKFHRQKMITGTRLIMSMPWRYFVGMGGRGRAPWCDDPPIVPRISGGKIYHYTNSMAVLEGRIPPLDGVDYEEFLETLQHQLLYGFHLPN